MNQPLISTSTNIFRFAEDGRADLVLDGGTCTGAGATTVDITELYWKIIREGAIAEKEIAEALQAT